MKKIKMIIKVAIYARVSKDRESSDGRLQDPKNQIDPLQQYADAMSYSLNSKHIYIDRVSGGTSDRPAFKEMMAEVKQRHIDLILVWSLDRFSREGIMHTLRHIETLKKYKCGLKSYTEQWLDTSDEGVGQIILSMMAWFAKSEREKISERTKAGLERARKKGVKLGRPRKKKRGHKKNPKFI
ncbi:MAG: recombinase family protein [Acidobacteriota bacterium]|nr:recombinase family protein [Acidobacteriota bacterium]